MLAQDVRAQWSSPKARERGAKLPFKKILALSRLLRHPSESWDDGMVYQVTYQPPRPSGTPPLEGNFKTHAMRLYG
jgi:hypothetical protein